MQTVKKELEGGRSNTKGIKTDAKHWIYKHDCTHTHTDIFRRDLKIDTGLTVVYINRDHIHSVWERGGGKGRDLPNREGVRGLKRRRIS